MTVDRMPRARLVRMHGDDQGTPGIVVSPGGWWHTLELPWRDNRRKLSCIPPGTYLCTVVQSPRFGRCYWVRDVPGRSEILIHPGNVAGEIPRWKSHVQGCIQLGMRPGTLWGQRAVLVSRPAVRAFCDAMAWRPFTLEVIGYGD